MFLKINTSMHAFFYRNMEPVFESQHLTIKKRRLHIKQATPVHNGIYKCQAENEAGSVMSISNFALAIPGNHFKLYLSLTMDNQKILFI